MAKTSTAKGLSDLTKWLLSVNQQTRKLRDVALDGVEAYASKNKSAIALVRKNLEGPWDLFETLWPPAFRGLPRQNYNNLARHVSFAQDMDYDAMLRDDLPGVERDAEDYFLAHLDKREDSFEPLLHPEIVRHSYDHYKRGKYRSAVFDSITVVVDMVRKKAKFDYDVFDADVINKAFGGESPRLHVSNFKGRPAKDEQKGFHMLFLGAWEGIRNPKAHTLESDLTANKAAQYLVFASLLARRVDEAKLQRAKRKSATT